MKLSTCVTGKPATKLRARRALTQCRCSVGIVFSTVGVPDIFWGHLWPRTITYAGLAGSVLFVLALHMSVPGPITHFARFICGYLGLVFCPESLGCGVRVLIESIRTQSHIFAKRSKRFVLFLDWFRQPIHL